MMVRDVPPHKDDVRVRVTALAKDCPAEMGIELLALYLPANSIQTLSQHSRRPPADRRCRVNVTLETLTKVDQHWAVQAVGESERKRGSENRNVRLVNKAIGEQLRLNVTAARPSDDDLLSRLALAYEMAAIEGLEAFLNTTSGDAALREQCAAGAWRAFDFGPDGAATGGNRLASFASVAPVGTGLLRRPVDRFAPLVSGRTRLVRRSIRGGCPMGSPAAVSLVRVLGAAVPQAELG